MIPTGLQPALLITSITTLTAATLLFLVAWAVAKRHYPPDVRLAGRAFSLWWAFLGVQAASDGLRILPAALTGSSWDAAYVALVYVKIMAAGVAIWGLSYYVVYLWTGRERLTFPLVGFALFHIGLFTYLTALREPTGAVVGTWATRLVMANPAVLPVALGAINLVFFFLPPIALAAAYLALLPRMDTPAQHFRVWAIALVIVVWNGTGMVLWNPDTSPDTWLVPVLVGLNALAAALAFVTYHPPSWLSARIAVRGIQEVGDRPRDIDPRHGSMT